MSNFTLSDDTCNRDQARYIFLVSLDIQYLFRLCGVRIYSAPRTHPMPLTILLVSTLYSFDLYHRWDFFPFPSRLMLAYIFFRSQNSLQCSSLSSAPELHCVYKRNVRWVEWKYIGFLIAIVGYWWIHFIIAFIHFRSIVMPYLTWCYSYWWCCCCWHRRMKCYADYTHTQIQRRWV